MWPRLCGPALSLSFWNRGHWQSENEAHTAKVSAGEVCWWHRREVSHLNVSLLASKDERLTRRRSKKHVTQNLKRSEILDFVQRDYDEYRWSLPTLDRKLRHFNISYIEYETPVEAVRDAVEKELEGPGKLLGYRAMNQKLRTEYNIKVPRHLVENVLGDLD